MWLEQKVMNGATYKIVNKPGDWKYFELIFVKEVDKDNHYFERLGLGDRISNSFGWRIRFNISVSDYEAFDTALHHQPWVAL
jgi:hypothetical protein